MTTAKEKELIAAKRRPADIAYRAANKDQKKKAGAAYYLANSDKIKKSSAEYYAANRGKIRRRNAARYAANPKKYIATSALWAKAHPEVRRMIDHNRRARELKCGGELSRGLRAKLFKLQQGKCPCCNEPLGDTYHMDHIVPFALSGTNTDDNIQLLRDTCNQQKCAKHPVDFMQERGFLI